MKLSHMKKNPSQMTKLMHEKQNHITTGETLKNNNKRK